MEKTIHFITGMPRGGATLLNNILAQNPRFHLASPPGILEVMYQARHRWNRVVEIKASPNEPGKVRVLRGMLARYYSGETVPQPVVFDKSRGWLGLLEMAELVLERPAKVLVPVRDVRDVMASFERLWQQNKDFRAAMEKSLPPMPKDTPKIPLDTPEQRCAVWARAEQPVGLAFNRIRDALARGFGDRIHFVEYEQLTRDPERTLSAIYEFLGETSFVHDFKNVKHVTWDVDEMLMYRVPGLPQVRPKVEPQQPRWPTVFGSWISKYVSSNAVWEQVRKTGGSGTAATLSSAPPTIG
jgi:sulfotransferase